MRSKTVVHVNDRAYRQAKRLAAATGLDMSTVVNMLIYHELYKAKRPAFADARRAFDVLDGEKPPRA